MLLRFKRFDYLSGECISFGLNFFEPPKINMYIAMQTDMLQLMAGTGGFLTIHNNIFN